MSGDAKSGGPRRPASGEHLQPPTRRQGQPETRSNQHAQLAPAAGALTLPTKPMVVEEEDIIRDPLLASVHVLWRANPLSDLLPINWVHITRSLQVLGTHSLNDPAESTRTITEFNWRTAAAATEVWTAWLAQYSGLPEPEPQYQTQPASGDKRFDAPEWQHNPVYRMIEQMYLLTSDYLQRQVDGAAELDPDEQQRLAFHVGQFIDALSPTNFPATNPVAVRRLLETGGTSVAEGVRNLLADLQQGQVSMTDTRAFQPGENLAITPGKVVYRNRLIELIQYTPQTEQTYAVPLMFVPPWINKYYILDMQPKNSFVRYLVEQGITVFMISWKNPDASMEDIAFEDYMAEGPLAASEVVREITGSETVNPVGYCIGGTLLAMTLAYLAAQKDTRFGATTFMVSLQDFSDVGETGAFIDEPQVDYIERQMLERGYLDSQHISSMFNLLRSNDLIWNNVVNNYLLGQQPPAFDLLYWNNDGTRMAPAAHGFYLRNTYLENNLIEPDKVALKGQPINLKRITQDLYAVGAEKDHIVPWYSAWRITQLTQGRTRFVLASSGHIAGIINPPSKGKGVFWVNEAAAPPSDADTWLKQATRYEGSWWTDWINWLADRSGEKVPAVAVGSRKHPPLCDAPGTYVLEK
ncbi:class I poly(R)-hydroxyalkanoic acid synthase [Aquisalimonas sp.]|uniref:PHA/PHB synthase family protein n=1 Tax=Aquisalimonas sp. TaxID=1872621 RepID=UPI0025C6C672|nr:class I poly(R)-hydroxyalkanoic acid synthase [Aquisalimonas sp.]